MMRLTKLSRALALGVFAVSTAAFAGVPSVDVKTQQPQPEQTDRLIVKYRDGSVVVQQKLGAAVQAHAVASDALSTRTQSLQQLAAPWGARVSLLRQTGTGAHVFKLDRALSVDQLRDLAAQIKASDANVEYVEPDRKMYALATPTDPSYATNQWDLFETTGGIRAPAAWDQSTGTGVVVAVIDTGYRPHADLAGQFAVTSGTTTVAGYDFIADTAVSVDGNARDSDALDPGDYYATNACGTGVPGSNSSWHGTHVAGTIAAKANNGIGIAGIAYNAKILPVRVLGKCGGYTSDIADGITWASGGTVSGIPANANVAKVLNLSLGGSGACDTTTQNAVNGARSRGSSVIVAAGNSAANAANYSPASCTGVVTVAATNRSGGRASYSNYGSIVALAAPGGDSGTGNGIYSTLNAGTTTPGADSYAYYSGTSMATPHVAGVAALLYSVKPTATPDQITAALKNSARAFPATCSQCGSGILDANAAITAILGTGGGGTAINETTASNDTRATAQVIASPGGVISGGLSSTSDTDYYAVSLGSGKTLTATLPVAAGNDYDLYLYNSSGTTLTSSTKSAGLTDSFSYTNSTSAAVTVYVRVAYYSGTATSYSLTLGW